VGYQVLGRIPGNACLRQPWLDVSYGSAKIYFMIVLIDDSVMIKKVSPNPEDRLKKLMNWLNKYIKLNCYIITCNGRV
jgi:hypothetical protein